MYLKNLEIENYRKFGSESGKASFVTPNKITSDFTMDERVSASTSLIVGRNNSGKTTVAKALEKIVNSDSELKHSDFNLNYLDEVFEKGSAPFLEFKLSIEFDREDAYIHKVMPFMCLDDEVKELDIAIKYVVEEEDVFISALSEIKKALPEITLKSRKKLYKLIDNTKFNRKIFNSNEKEVNNFKLSDLINLKIINADKEVGGKKLSEAFNKIFHSKFIKDIVGKEKLDKLEGELEAVGSSIEKSLEESYGTQEKKISKLLQDRSDTTFRLACDLDHESLLRDVISYEYQDGEYRIPEDQFRLGYTNLMLIIAQIIEYIEREYNSENKDGINIICIEEPEAFMHPEMQKLFMQNIAKTVEEILRETQLEKANFQLIITTHSPFILQSKIKLGNSFDDINYMNHSGSILNLKDEDVISETMEEKKGRLELEEKIKNETNKKTKQEYIDKLAKLERNIKLKYIAVKVTSEYSEVFFADAILAVEGDAEKSLLPRFLEMNENLKNRNISILNIGGAHGHMFVDFFKALNIPIVVITDLDIVRKKESKEIKDGKEIIKLIDHSDQIISLSGVKTTNNSLKFFFKTEELEKIVTEEMKVSENIYVSTQNELIEGYYATSLEEAMILSNCGNERFLKILREIRPQVANGEKKEILKKSYKIQKSLDSKSGKTELASQLNYELVTNAGFKEEFIVPKYIEEGINYLVTQIEGDR